MEAERLPLGQHRGLRVDGPRLPLPPHEEVDLLHPHLLELAGPPGGLLARRGGVRGGLGVLDLLRLLELLLALRHELELGEAGRVDRLGGRKRRALGLALLLEGEVVLRRVADQPRPADGVRGRRRRPRRGGLVQRRPLLERRGREVLLLRRHVPGALGRAEGEGELGGHPPLLPRSLGGRVRRGGAESRLRRGHPQAAGGLLHRDGERQRHGRGADGRRRGGGRGPVGGVLDAAPLERLGDRQGRGLDGRRADRLAPLGRLPPPARLGRGPLGLLVALPEGLLRLLDDARLVGQGVPGRLVRLVHPPEEPAAPGAHLGDYPVRDAVLVHVVPGRDGEVLGPLRRDEVAEGYVARLLVRAGSSVFIGSSACSC